MKYIIISIILSIFVNASEINRVQTIIKDINTLREDYNRCKKELEIQNISNNIIEKIDSSPDTKEELKKYKKLLDKEKLKNTILIAKFDLLNNNNEKSNNKSLKLCKTKEKENKRLIKKYIKEMQNKDNIIKNLKNQIKLTKNTTSTSLKIDQNNIKENKIVETKKIIEKKVFSKASTYRTTKNSNIYNAVNGKILYEWERNIAFTSNVMTQNWVKITGYFIDDKWRRSKEKLWIKKTNIVKR